MNTIRVKTAISPFNIVLWLMRGVMPWSAKENSDVELNNLFSLFQERNVWGKNGDCVLMLEIM